MALILTAKIITGGLTKDVVTVTGSYSQNVTSDNGRVEFDITARKPNKAEAYNTLNQQRPIVMKYLLDKGFTPDNIDSKTVNGYYTYKVLPNGTTTNETAYFNATQQISVKQIA